MPASDWSAERWQDKKELYMYLKQIINSYWSLLTNCCKTSSFFGKLNQGFEGRTEKQLKFNNVPAICTVSGNFEELEFTSVIYEKTIIRAGQTWLWAESQQRTMSQETETYIQVTIWLSANIPLKLKLHAVSVITIYYHISNFLYVWFAMVRHRYREMKKCPFWWITMEPYFIHNEFNTVGLCHESHVWFVNCEFKIILFSLRKWQFVIKCSKYKTMIVQ